MLWFALHLSALPLEALLVALPAMPLSDAPARCVVEQRRVLHACSRAAAAGVQPGMSAASAAALLPGLQLLVRNAAREAAFVERLALALARYTPAVVLEPDGILLEVAASLRLFGGPRALWRAVRDSARASGVGAARLAAASTAGAASLLARVAAMPRRGESIGGVTTNSDAEWWQRTRARLDALPLAAAMAVWQLPAHTTALLQGVGCRTLADVRALPRTGLQRRGGGLLLARLTQAYGEAPDPRAWFVPPARFELGLELLHRADDAAMLVVAAERLVQPLAGWLARQWLAAARLTLCLRHETSLRHARPDTVLRIDLGQPSRAVAQIMLLLRERLQRCELPAPVYALTLRLDEAASHAGQEAGLWPDAQRQGDDVRALIDRLGARLGPERVQRLQMRADHRPERAMAVVSAAVTIPSASHQAAVWPQAAPPRPAWLLPTPLRLPEQAGRPVHGSPLILRSRAERIEAGWFDGELICRDYHVAEGRDQRLRWVFCERRGGAAQWFLQGLFG